MTRSQSPYAIAKSLERTPVNSNQYRPKDYFGRYDELTRLMTRVKGTFRRKALREMIDRGQLGSVPSAIQCATLSEPVRNSVGRINPVFMGGEYLPNAYTSELEIARIRVKSTTGDVTSVYARPVGTRIAYRVVDEYQGDTLSGRTRRTSIKPLTMGCLIEFFLEAWDLFLCLDSNFEDNLDEMLDFFEGESEFYPAFESELRRRVREKFSYLKPQGRPLAENEDEHVTKLSQVESVGPAGESHEG